MLGLRFYACRACDAVHAGPDPPPACGRCGGERLTDITGSLQDPSYFAPPDAPGGDPENRG